MEPSPGVAAARAAMAAGDLPAARAALDRATAAGPDPVAHEMLAGMCLMDDDVDGARAHFESAFRLWRDAGAARPAALVAAHLAEVHSSWMGNRIVGQGWIARAQRLLDDEGPCIERGYVELALLACDVDDVDALLGRATTALALARQFGDVELEIRALADSGYALVVQGRLDEGFPLLDEAMTALSAGEVTSPSVAGMSFCALLAACERTGDVARAEEWTRVVAAVVEPLGNRPRALHTHCRLVYGSVLCTAGRVPEGEAALLDALGAEASTIHLHRSEAAARLAAVRLLQGRVDEAAELLRPFEERVNACEPLARVHLAKGELDLAEAVARRGLGLAKNDCLRAGALLSLLVEVELARDDPDAARGHAAELDALAEHTTCRLLRVDAALARGRLAAASPDPAAAVTAFEQARRELHRDERPVVAGLIAIELAQALAEMGDRGAAIDHARAALAAFDRVGAAPLVDRTNAVLRSLGAPARTSARPAAAAVAGLTAREQQVLSLVREGLTNAEIGDRLYISAKTAEHHVGRVLAKLGVRSRAEAAAVASAAAAATPTPR